MGDGMEAAAPVMPGGGPGDKCPHCGRGPVDDVSGQLADHAKGIMVDHGKDWLTEQAERSLGKGAVPKKFDD